MKVAVNMVDLTPIFSAIQSVFPFECMQFNFMQQAMFAILLLAPMAASMGIQVVNFRMAFFADAISHSAFAGVAIGLLFGINPQFSMPVFGLIVGLSIMAMQRKSSLSSDTVIGVVFSAVIAFGLAVVSRDPSSATNIQQFLYGDILTIGKTNINLLIILFVLLMTFQTWGYNQMLYIGLNPSLATAHRVKVALFQYIYAGLLSVVIIFSVWAVGVLLVTALLIVPAAAARNLSRSAGAMFWWAIIISITSASSGLIISAQDWAGTATGATIILCCFCWFVLSFIIALLRGESKK